MIIVSGQLLRPQDIENWKIDKNLNPLLKEMIETPVQFDYHSIAELMFELNLRMNIVAAAKTLHKSGAKFATFLKTYGNTKYWRVSPEGALELKYRMPPSKAIRDIAENGPFYAFECATAIVVIYYLALIDTIGEKNLMPTLTELFYMTGIMRNCRYIRKQDITFSSEIVCILRILNSIRKKRSGEAKM